MEDYYLSKLEAEVFDLIKIRPKGINSINIARRVYANTRSGPSNLTAGVRSAVRQINRKLEKAGHKGRIVSISHGRDGATLRWEVGRND